MLIFPAIDLYEGKAVRLLKGDYSQMTVYSRDPVAVARSFREQGATCLHLVDLQGAKTGKPEHRELVSRIAEAFGGFVELGGGIRDLDTVEAYLASGVNRVILGTAAVQDPAFLETAIQTYGNRVAVGVDIKDGFVAIKGWTENSGLSAEEFFSRMQRLGVDTVICTDISRDGAMQGTNRELYARLSRQYAISLVASGGVSSLEDIRALRELNLYGAIIGKAYYVGAVKLAQAIEEAK